MKNAQNDPEPFKQETEIGDNAYPMYRRREEEDGGRIANKYDRGTKEKITNEDVISY